MEYEQKGEREGEKRKRMKWIAARGKDRVKRDKSKMRERVH